MASTALDHNNNDFKNSEEEQQQPFDEQLRQQQQQQPSSSAAEQQAPWPGNDNDNSPPQQQEKQQLDEREEVPPKHKKVTTPRPSQSRPPIIVSPSSVTKTKITVDENYDGDGKGRHLSDGFDFYDEKKLVGTATSSCGLGFQQREGADSSLSAATPMVTPIKEKTQQQQITPSSSKTQKITLSTVSLSSFTNPSFTNLSAISDSSAKWQQQQQRQRTDISKNCEKFGCTNSSTVAELQEIIEDVATFFCCGFTTDGCLFDDDTHTGKKNDEEQQTARKEERIKDTEDVFLGKTIQFCGGKY